jgi:hypothetical protein
VIGTLQECWHASLTQGKVIRLIIVIQQGKVIKLIIVIQQEYIKEGYFYEYRVHNILEFLTECPIYLDDDLEDIIGIYKGGILL